MVGSLRAVRTGFVTAAAAATAQLRNRAVSVGRRLAAYVQPRRQRCQRCEDDAPRRHWDPSQHQHGPGASFPPHRRPARPPDAPLPRRRIQCQHRHGRCGKHLPRLDADRRARDPCAAAERSPDADPEGAGRRDRGEDRGCAKRPRGSRLAEQRREPHRIGANPGRRRHARRGAAFHRQRREDPGVRPRPRLRRRHDPGLDHPRCAAEHQGEGPHPRLRQPSALDGSGDLEPPVSRAVRSAAGRR